MAANLKIKVEYDGEPPEAFLTEFRELVSKYPGIQVQLSMNQTNVQSSCSHKRSYVQVTTVSMNNLKKHKVSLSGSEEECKEPPTTEVPDRCPYCRLSPCVVIQAPSWLTGSAHPNLANNSKRYKLYRKFWRLLNQLGFWNDPLYLQHKQTVTTVNDPRDIMPNCVITEVRRRFPNPANIPYTDFIPT